MKKTLSYGQYLLSDKPQKKNVKMKKEKKRVHELNKGREPLI